MRAHNDPNHNNTANHLRLITLGLTVLAALTAGPLSAQSSPGSFSLPEPTPTPTPAPQGPVDIRDGVVIGPRSIPDQPKVAAPTPAASPAAPPTSTTSPSAAPSTLAPPTEAGRSVSGIAPTRTPSPSPSPSRSNQAPPNSQPESTAPSSSSSPSRAPAGPGPAENDAANTAANTAPEGAQSGFAGNSIAPLNDPGGGALPVGPVSDPSDTASSTAEDESADASSNWQLIIALSAVLAALAAAGWWVWLRKRRAAPKGALMPAPALAQSPPRTVTPQQPAEPAMVEPNAQAAPLAPMAAADLPRMALKLEIASASRSLMMFTVEYRLEIANRGDKALRDLNISARLVCARRAANGSPETVSKGKTVDRIGPHQSGAISGSVQLPLSEISPLRQGTVPLLIPLIEISISPAGQSAKTHKFVVGMPSASSATRLHPIPLDTAPGGIQGLRANEIKETASAA
ncbi:hypothetical protein FGU71_01590 [Erythrobacter insulae]|uniref:Uncharacterized protein n=1 Tax=Erythrobacter insulae TaxID=2584124 RepID=A0A547P9E3_9SPHN|nr:hypothetical protein [Erythrobacter insulae]TRD10684.1 hypothetical protein FGU71_01590 [Erythrobacter insulae]